MKHNLVISHYVQSSYSVFTLERDKAMKIVSDTYSVDKNRYYCIITCIYTKRGDVIMNQNSSPCTCLNLRRASKTLTDIYDKYLTSCQLSISQYSILRHINCLAPVSVSNLSIALRLDRTTLVRSLKPLEERELVEDISEDGTRNRELQLTEDGKNVFQSANGLWEKAQSDLVEYLGREDAEKFSEMLEKIEKYRSE